jgi:hypothetical protein
MSQSLQNQAIYAKSMNGIISISDGAGTTIENGTIISNDITTNSLTTGDLTLNGSLEIPLVNDIFVSNTGGTQMVSLYNKGKTYLEQDTHMNKAFSYNTPTTGYEVTNKTYVDLKAENIKVTNNETNATYYPIFTDNFGTSQSAFIDKTTTPFSINPNTGNMKLANTIKIDSSFNLTIGFFESKVAIGAEAGITNQEIDTLALGSYAGSINQKQGSMAFGNSAGYENQGNQSVAVGNFAGCYNQASGSICIGSNAGAGSPSGSGSGTDSIIINAGTGAPLNNTKSNALFINPIANSTTDTANQMVTYNATTKEVCRQSGITIDSTQNQLTVGTFQANGTQVEPTILNQYFQTPVRTNGTSTFVTTLPDWTFAIPTGRLVHGRGGTNFNSNRGIFPISGQSQYLAYNFNSTVGSITVSQNITFTQTGDYLLTYYALGNINSYSGATESVVASIAGSTQTAILTESVWCLQKMRFRVTSIVSPINLSFVGSTTFATVSGTNQRTFCIYGIEIHKCIGVNVSDGGITNHQLLEYNGINTTDIFNSGDIINYGRTLLFGGLELYNRYAPSTTLICDSIYGSSSTSTGGRVIAIGNASALNGVHLLDVMAIGVEACQNVGPVSFSTSYAGANTGIIAIGYRALRGFNGLVSTGSSSLQNYFIGHDAGRLLTIPTGSHRYNLAMGYQVLNGRAGSTNIQYNALYGHNIMSTVTGVSSTIQGNSVFGNESFLIATGANNTSVGYNNFNLGTNTATNNNSFFGANVCNTQAGGSNVMTNCSFFGSNTDVSVAGNYSNSTCLGYNSRITGNNQIILGTAGEITYPMGGLNIPTGTVLTLLGNISANLLTVTPTQLSFLNKVTADKIPGSAINSAVTSATNIAGGSTYNIPYQSGVGATSFLTNGSAGQVLTSGAGSGVPTWTTPSIPTLETVVISGNNSGGRNIYSGAIGITRVPGTTVTATVNTNTSTMLWDGKIGFGETDFVNQRGSGNGGFYFYSTDSNTVDYTTPICFIDGYGNITCPTFFGALNVPIGRTITLNGDITANSSTVTPTQLSFLSLVISNQIPASAVNGTVTSATNIAGGSTYNIPYQSGTGATSFLTNGSAGQVLTSGAGSGIPTWTTPSIPALDAVVISGNNSGGRNIYSGAVTVTKNVNTVTASVDVNSTTMMWNGKDGFGISEFINQRGLGGGGFRFYSLGVNNTTVDFDAPITSIDNTGNITAPSFIGALSGNASTATRANTAAYIVAVNTTPNISTNPEYLNATLYLSSTSALTLTIIDAGSVNQGFEYKFYNNSNFVITLSVSVANLFIGKYGNNLTTYEIAPNNWVQLNSYLSNWYVFERSEDYFNSAPLSITTSTNIRLRYEYVNTLFRVNPNANGYTLTIPRPEDVRNTYYNIENTSENFLLTLSNGSPSTGSFIGSYGSNAQTLLLPPLSSVNMFSNGQDWICNSVSNSGWNYPPTNTNSNIDQFVGQWMRTYTSIGLNSSWNLYLQNICGSANQHKEGLEIEFRKFGGNLVTTSGNIVLYPAQPSQTGSTFTLYNNSNGIGAYPMTGDSLVRLNGSTVTIKCYKVGLAGSGTASVTAGLMNVTATTGLLTYGTQVTLNSVVYTIRGLQSFNAGTVTFTSGASTGTMILNVAPIFGMPTIGCFFTVAGVNYTITNMTYEIEIGAGVPTTPFSITISPVAPIAWTNTAFSVPQTGQGGTGTYVVAPTTNSASLSFTNNSYYSWGIK